MTHRPARRRSALFALCLAAAPATQPAATPDVTRDVTPDAAVAVPAGVVYRPAPAEANAKAIAVVHRLFSPAATDDQLRACFDEVLVCGPGLWDQLKGDPAVIRVRHGDVTLLVAAADGAVGRDGKPKPTALHGAVFRTPDDILACWKAVRGKAVPGHAAAQTPDVPRAAVTVRKLTPAELSVYWGMVSFDLTEPIFVADCGPRHLLLNFVGPDKVKVLWTDDLAAYPAAKPTTAPAAAVKR